LKLGWCFKQRKRYH